MTSTNQPTTVILPGIPFKLLRSINQQRVLKHALYTSCSRNFNPGYLLEGESVRTLLCIGDCHISVNFFHQTLRKPGPTGMDRFCTTEDVLIYLTMSWFRGFLGKDHSCGTFKEKRTGDLRISQGRIRGWKIAV